MVLFSIAFSIASSLLYLFYTLVFRYYLLEPEVYQKQPLYLHNVGVRCVHATLPDPIYGISDYTGYIFGHWGIVKGSRWTWKMKKLVNEGKVQEFLRNWLKFPWERISSFTIIHQNSAILHTLCFKFGKMMLCYQF